MCALVDAQLELHVLATTELAMAEEHDAKVELLERAGSSDAGIGRLVVVGPGGPLPILVLADGHPPSRLDPLLSLEEDVQVVIVGGGDAVVRWARLLGPDRAGVVDRSVLV